MANTRPIRRGRVPFRRGRRWTSSAPKLSRRWLDANSSRDQAIPCTLGGKDLQCDEPDGAPVQLLYGDTDWDWADNSEVRIDRILGTISWDSWLGSSSLTAGDPPPVVVRLGIIATEEDGAVPPTLDLFDPEYLEEYQWMWLYSSQGHHSATADGGLVRIQYDNIDLDVRTRRTLGKKDSVWLYGQFKYNTSVSLAAGIVGRNPRVSHQLRVILRS